MLASSPLSDRRITVRLLTWKRCATSSMVRRLVSMIPNQVTTRAKREPPVRPVNYRHPIRCLEFCLSIGGTIISPMPTTGEFLRQVREAKGMSLRALAERVGTSFSYLQRLETGGVSPSLATLARICQVYGVETFEAVAGMSRLEMVRQTLGPVPLDDPAVRQMLLLAASPDGPAQIRDAGHRGGTADPLGESLHGAQQRDDDGTLVRSLQLGSARSASPGNAGHRRVDPGRGRGVAT